MYIGGRWLLKITTFELNLIPGFYDCLLHLQLFSNTSQLASSSIHPTIHPSPSSPSIHPPSPSIHPTSPASQPPHPSIPVIPPTSFSAHPCTGHANAWLVLLFVFFFLLFCFFLNTNHFWKIVTSHDTSHVSLTNNDNASTFSFFFCFFFLILIFLDTN